jgi:hypothetical protein
MLSRYGVNKIADPYLTANLIKEIFLIYRNKKKKVVVVGG